MENFKAQGRASGEIDGMAASVKLLALGKFREAELMAEQYLTAHGDDAMAHLVLYCARAGMRSLAPFVAGEWNRIVDDEILLTKQVIEHRELLFTFLRLSTEHQSALFAKFFVDYCAFLANNSSLCPCEVLDGDPQGARDFFDTLTNFVYTHEREAYAQTVYRIGGLFLSHAQYESARDYFENALAQGYDRIECLWSILFCAMHINSREEFASSRHFRVDMPEYINLLASLAEDEEEMCALTRLAEENERSAQQSRTAQRQRTHLKAPLAGVNPVLRFFLMAGFYVGSVLGLFYFFFFLEDGGWDIFVQLSPFGRAAASDVSGASLIVSTVVVALAFVLGLSTLDDVTAATARKKVLLLLLNIAFCFALWYIGYAIAYWFRGLNMFFSILFSIVLDLLVGFISAGVYITLAAESLKGCFDRPADTLLEQLWARGYNRMMLGIVYLCVGVYSFLHVEGSGLSIAAVRISPLSLFCAVFFCAVGLYILLSGAVDKCKALSNKLCAEEDDGVRVRAGIASAEFNSSVAYLCCLIPLVVLALLLGFELSVIIAPTVLLLLSGLFGIAISGAKRKG